MNGREAKECIADLEIEYMNKQRNIPAELSEEEKLLYAFSQNVTLQLLQAMHDKYMNPEEKNLTISEPAEEEASLPQLIRE